MHCCVHCTHIHVVRRRRLALGALSKWSLFLWWTPCSVAKWRNHQSSSYAYTYTGLSFVHFLDYAQLKNSRKSEFLAKNLSFQPKNRWVFLEILSFSKVYWSKPLVIKAEILSFHWYWPEFLENLSFRRLWVFRKVDNKKSLQIGMCVWRGVQRRRLYLTRLFYFHY